MNLRELGLLVFQPHGVAAQPSATVVREGRSASAPGLLVIALKRALPLVLFVAAALYFSFGRNTTLDMTDEGHIVYPCWLTAMGAIPHRDFRQLYGPSLFFLNGAALSVFGSDLAVLRWLLVALKAAVVTLVFFASRTVASPLVALLVSLLCICVWGAPWWVFNAPYANHYGLLLTLLGVLGYWTLQRRFILACFVAGICFGTASTFKPTSGVFAALAFVLFLIWDSQPTCTPSVRSSVGRAVQVLRLLALLAVALISMIYLAPRNTVWNVAMLITPLALALLLLARREVWPWPSRLPALEGHSPVASSAADADHSNDRIGSTIGILATAGGLLVPIAGYAVYYASIGALASVGADLLNELPSRIQWFVPLAVPQRRPALVALTLISIFVAFRAQHPASNRPVVLSAVAIAAVSVAVLLHETIVAPGLHAYALMMFWHHDLEPMTYVIPFAVVWATGAPVLLHRRRVPTAVGLFYFFAVTSLLFLYPAADFWHVLMGLPAFLPLLAYQLERSAASPRTPARAGMILVVVVLLSAPFVDTLRFVLRTPVASPARLARATGVATTAPQFADTVDLVQFLDTEPRDVPLLTLANEQMLNFLAGRSSPVSGDEYVLYLVAVASIADDVARDMVTPQRLIERIEAAKPLIIDDTESAIAGRFQRVFPEVAAFVARHYAPAHTIGRFRVLRWAQGDRL